MPSQIYVARFPSRTRADDLEDAFKKFGKIKDLVMKGQYAFIDYEQAEDAENAVKEMDNSSFDGERLIVEAAVGRKKTDNRREPREGGREGRGGPQSGDVCFNCGKAGHWANECREERKSQRRDIRDLTCFKCGKRGHKKFDCNERSRSRSGSYSSRSRSGGRRRSPSSSSSRDRNRKKSYRRSRTPERRRRSPERRRSPDRRRSPSRSGSASRSPRGRPANTKKSEEPREERKSID